VEGTTPGKEKILEKLAPDSSLINVWQGVGGLRNQQGREACGGTAGISQINLPSGSKNHFQKSKASVFTWTVRSTIPMGSETLEGGGASCGKSDCLEVIFRRIPCDRFKHQQGHWAFQRMNVFEGHGALDERTTHGVERDSAREQKDRRKKEERKKSRPSASSKDNQRLLGG